MSTTAERLAAYRAAELEILQAQEISGAGRAHKMADLATVRTAIADLERQLAREQAAAAGQGGLNYALANLSGYDAGRR